MIRRILNNCIKYIQPPIACEFCLSQATAPICDDCYIDLPWLAHHCTRCGRGGAVEGICIHCQKGGYAFDQCFIPFNYQSPLSNIISQFKFNHQLHQARTLSYCFVQAAKDNALPRPELLIPVPAHPRRVWHRGFNQSIELTRFIAKAFDLPWDANLVARTQHTPPQNKLKQRQRRKNLNNAFACKKPCDLQHVVIVDDVVTTGTTVNTIAKVLKEAGVARVDVWGICESVTKMI